MGQNIGTGGRAWGKILGRCVEYTGVTYYVIKITVPMKLNRQENTKFMLLSLDHYHFL